jgi:predicted secreted protein
MPAHTYVNGFGGSISMQTTTLDVDTWSLNVTGEALDTTNTGDVGWETNILGAKAFEGSVKTYWDSAAVPTGAADFTAGKRATLNLPVSATGKTYTGTAQITSVAIENPTKGVVTFQFNFKGSGVLTYAS